MFNLAVFNKTKTLSIFFKRSICSSTEWLKFYLTANRVIRKLKLVCFDVWFIWVTSGFSLKTNSFFFFLIRHPLDFILLSLFFWSTALLPPAAEDQQMLIRSQWVFLNFLKKSCIVSLLNTKDFNANPDYNMSGESLLMEEVKLHNLIFNYISFRAYSHHHPLLNTKNLDKELLEENMSCLRIYSTHAL